MTRRYAILFAAVLAAAGLMSLLGRARHPAVTPPAPVAAPSHTTLRVTIDAAGLAPARAQVQRDHVVDLEIVNDGARPARVSLSGYEDRVDLKVPAAGRAQTSFLADRPGEGFAWIVDGAPSGRLEVAGSHLVEGHR